NAPPRDDDLASPVALLGEAEVSSIAALARLYQRATSEAVEAWASNRFASSAKRTAQLTWLDLLARQGLLDGNCGDADAGADEPLSQLLAEYRQIESSIPDPARVPAMTDGNGFDEF